MRLHTSMPNGTLKSKLSSRLSALRARKQKQKHEPHRKDVKRRCKRFARLKKHWPRRNADGHTTGIPLISRTSGFDSNGACRAPFFVYVMRILRAHRS